MKSKSEMKVMIQKLMRFCIILSLTMTLLATSLCTVYAWYAIMGQSMGNAQTVTLQGAKLEGSYKIECTFMPQTNEIVSIFVIVENTGNRDILCEISYPKNNTNLASSKVGKEYVKEYVEVGTNTNSIESTESTNSIENPKNIKRVEIKDLDTQTLLNAADISRSEISTNLTYDYDEVETFLEGLINQTFTVRYCQYTRQAVNDVFGADISNDFFGTQEEERISGYE